MKNVLRVLGCAVIIFSLVGCTKKKTEEEAPKVYTAAELKTLASSKGYIANDYIACYTGLTEDQMEGFTVDLALSETKYGSYCIIVAENETYAKQACEAVAGEFNTCVRNDKVVFFPEVDASTDTIKMLTSIAKGDPIKPIDYTKKTVEEKPIVTPKDKEKK